MVTVIVVILRGNNDGDDSGGDGDDDGDDSGDLAW